MAVRKAKAVWEGNLLNGKGTVEVESGLFKGSYSFLSRFEEGKGTNPEELLGAAHAACYSMALSSLLEKNGFKPVKISTQSSVHIEKTDGGFSITKIILNTQGKVPGIDEKTFIGFAGEAKISCPVSKALASTNIELIAALE
ncbi:MAG: OsmC family protein [Candidatus Humimicrobiaceae bacterium]